MGDSDIKAAKVRMDDALAVYQKAEAEAERLEDLWLEARKEYQKYRREHGKVFTDSELIYSAVARCKCGAGLAYAPDMDMDAWHCSVVLTTGIVETSSALDHSYYPFAFYEIKSENQPSASGDTTRPKP